jgi:hypothetical protein
VQNSAIRFAIFVATLASVHCSEPRSKYTAPPPGLKRLTASQLENTLRDHFGASLVLPPPIEADVSRDDSLLIGTSQSGYSARGVEMSRSLAEDVAAQALSDTGLIPCAPEGVRDDTCARSFVAAQGRLLWRRALEEDEIVRLVTLAGSAATLTGDFRLGLRYALVALLMSPDFLFRTEFSASSGDLASRLSFFLWNAAPDATLLDAAAAGELDSQEGLERHVTRMLAAPQARRGVRAFLDDWLQLSRLGEMVRDTNLFPSFSPDLAPSAREEVLRTGELLIFDKDADIREWLTTRETFVNRRLAALYGVPFPLKQAPQSEFALVTLPDNGPRAGLLGTAAVLAGNAHPTTTSPTVRGRYMSQVLLCTPISDPPAGVNTGIPEPAEGAVTLRERVLAHLNAEGCNTCHQKMDPQGLGFEAFDAIGRFRTEDGGKPVDASGEWNNQKFTTLRGLAEIVRNDERFPSCVTKRLFRYAHGRTQLDTDRPEMDRLTRRFAASGFKVLALMESIATSDSFRQTGEVSE